MSKILETKQLNFGKLFKQKSFTQFFNSRQEINTLFSLLTIEEINRLVELNVIFVRCCAPSSKVNLDTNYYSKLHPDEFVGVLLHEIGHVFNPDLQNMEGEYAADNFAKQKKYDKWIISGLQKGVKNNWMGFDEQSCNLRIEKLRESK